MLKTTKPIGIFAGIIGLAACSTFNPNGYTNFQTYNDHGMELYPESYENVESTTIVYPKPAAVVVPESYHVSTYHAPVVSREVDQLWVKSQSASGYTIELASDVKPTVVANTLVKTPKKERTAQIKTTNGSYVGVYGTYPTQQAAQQALDTLPADIRHTATVKTWSSIQSGL